jgi:hypothetical protein
VWEEEDHKDESSATTSGTSTEAASTNSSHEYDHTPEGVRKTTPKDGLRFATGRGQQQAARDNDDTEGPEHAGREQHYQVRPGTRTADRETDDVTSDVTIG